MKNSKLISLALALIFIFSAIAPMSVSAEGTLDDHLIIHYDFEGKTLSEALKDKAPPGSAKDDLVCYPTGTANGSVATGSDDFNANFEWNKKGGIMTNAAGKASLQAVNSADVQMISATNTCRVIRFKMNEINQTSPAQNTFLISFQNAWNNLEYTLYLATENGVTNLMSCTTKHATNMASRAFTKHTTIESEEYVNIAINISVASNKMTFGTFVSYGEPTKASDWTALDTLQAAYYTNTAVKNAANLSLFGAAPGSESSPSITLDDYRLYNKTLNVDDLVQIPFVDPDDRISAPDIYPPTSDPLAPVYRGCQVSKVDDNGEFSARFVATTDVLSYKELGFEIALKEYNGNNSGAVVYSTRTVFKAINGTDTLGRSIKYSAEELGGKYILALSVEEIPTDYPVEFIVTPYYIPEDSVDDSHNMGTSYVIRFENGKMVSQAVPSIVTE